jgi:23S rRNA (adenine2030-N6)-methyltransferase
MNYRHAFHAGNFGDVLKHAVLARVLVHLAEKPQPFRVIDTHAGAGLYDLTKGEAARTGEWRDGIGRLREQNLADAPARLLAPYLDAVASVNPGGALTHYPGSPLVALSLMRPQDRLTACDIEPAAVAGLRRCLARDRRAKAVAIDGWTAATAYVPPKERRGVVLIDPPFEDRAEFHRLLEVFSAAHRRWPTGTYLLWYPVTAASPVEEFARRLRQAQVPKLLRVEWRWRSEPAARRLTGSGLIIANPPWHLPDELNVIGPALAGRDGTCSHAWLTAETSS